MFFFFYFLLFPSCFISFYLLVFLRLSHIPSFLPFSPLERSVLTSFPFLNFLSHLPSIHPSFHLSFLCYPFPLPSPFTCSFFRFFIPHFLLHSIPPIFCSFSFFLHPPFFLSFSFLHSFLHSFIPLISFISLCFFAITLSDCLLVCPSVIIIRMISEEGVAECL